MVRCGNRAGGWLVRLCAGLIFAIAGRCFVQRARAQHGRTGQLVLCEEAAPLPQANTAWQRKRFFDCFLDAQHDRGLVNDRRPLRWEEPCVWYVAWAGVYFPAQRQSSAVRQRWRHRPQMSCRQMGAARIWGVSATTVLSWRVA